jgi:RHS repeat-associated protein
MLESLTNAGNAQSICGQQLPKKFSSNYVPYGGNYALSGKEVFMYTGKPLDLATGLYYEGARYYDATLGRFTIQDSITGTQYDPMSLNRYVYARDNPMKIVDLAGHEWWNPLSAITSAASAVTTGITGAASALSNAANSIPPLVSSTVITMASYVQPVVQAASSYLDATNRFVNSVVNTSSQIMTNAGSVMVSNIVTPSSPVIGQINSFGSKVLRGLEGAAGAAVVDGAATGTVLGLAATYGVPGIGQAAVIGSLAIGAGFAIGYTIKNGGKSTPGGALNAFEQGVEVIPEGVHILLNRIQSESSFPLIFY